MTPDLYGAWLTAGNNLQPIGDWIVDFVLTVGPGCLLCAAMWLAIWAWDKASPALARRHQRRREIRQLRQLYKQPSTHPGRRTRREKP